MEALVPLRPRNEVGAEDLVGVDGGECEVVRDGRRPEEDAADGESEDDEDADGALQNASPAAGTGAGSSSASTSRLPSSTGPEYG